MTKSYQGGKGASGVAEQIINRMPKHTAYIETHLGSGRVLLKKKPAEWNAGIDLSLDVIRNFKVPGTVTVDLYAMMMTIES